MESPLSELRNIYSKFKLVVYIGSIDRKKEPCVVSRHILNTHCGPLIVFFIFNLSNRVCSSFLCNSWNISFFLVQYNIPDHASLNYACLLARCSGPSCPDTLMLSRIGDRRFIIPDLVLGRSFSACRDGGSLRPSPVVPMYRSLSASA